MRTDRTGKRRWGRPESIGIGCRGDEKRMPNQSRPFRLAGPFPPAPSPWSGRPCRSPVRIPESQRAPSPGPEPASKFLGSLLSVSQPLARLALTRPSDSVRASVCVVLQGLVQDSRSKVGSSLPLPADLDMAAWLCCRCSAARMMSRLGRGGGGGNTDGSSLASGGGPGHSGSRPSSYYPQWGSPGTQHLVPVFSCWGGP